MIVKVRHSSNTGNTPVALANGELALNNTDQLLYYRHANGAILILANGASLLTFTTAQVSSNVNQVPANTSAWKITFSNNDLLIGTAHDPGNTRVTVLSNGWYTVVATGNYLRTFGGGNARFADCWLRINNVDVESSATRVTLDRQLFSYPMAIQQTIRLNANDYVELIQAVDSTAGAPGLQVAVTLAGGPLLRSVSLSITKISN
jgi:hypothetical protein